MDNDYAKYILDKTKKDYNNIALKYSQVRSKEWREMEFLFDRVDKNDKVLDLGCANGRFYPLFEKKEADYYGIDLSSNLIKIAKDKYPQARFSVGTGLEILFEDNFFDKIYSIAVLHHIPSEKLRKDFLKEINRVLKNKGLLILTVWNLKEKESKGIKNEKLDQNDIFLSWYGADDCYFHIFDLYELENLVKEVGLKIIEKGEIIVGQRPYINFYIICEKHE
ncbi:MAG: class I SAM-dependent methyltransferase [Candidatus Pacebacteria bacterium]|jgi:ubiquinone/menaquinone biosynthesis C-methylase UbiE|nr:class I SAM-dependent methyltransferase [Candidatus Paceibacterota bacterium]MDD5012821.1 class I SAM-dependent methyltransferase [Candidatus Paceibacterota bacterium]